MKQDNELEKKFEEELSEWKKKGEEIEHLTDQAKDLLKQAIKVSDETGIPISHGISFMENIYIPEKYFEIKEKLEEKYQKLDEEVYDGDDFVAQSICDEMNAYGEYDGWQASDSVCIGF